MGGVIISRIIYKYYVAPTYNTGESFHTSIKIMDNCKVVYNKYDMHTRKKVSEEIVTITKDIGLNIKSIIDNNINDITTLPNEITNLGMRDGAVYTFNFSKYKIKVNDLPSGIEEVDSMNNHKVFVTKNKVTSIEDYNSVVSFYNIVYNVYSQIHNILEENNIEVI